jgi:hypothetical protein
MPQIIVESGTTRRIVSYTHQSSFIENEKLVDKSKHIYLLDKHIINNMRDMNLLEAWFDILVEYCFNWLNGTKPVYGNNFIESKDAIVNNSDIFQDFIDSKLKVTNNDADKISKDTMRNEFLKMYPDKHLTTIQIMSSLKDRNIKYNTNLRSTGNIRGCYYGVKFSLQDDQDDEDYNNGINNADQAVDINLKYKELEQQYKELQEKYNILNSKQNKISVNDFCDEFDEVKEITIKPQKQLIEIDDEAVTVEASKTKKAVLSKEEKKKLSENEAKNATVKEDVENCRKKLTHLLVL